MHTKYVVLVTIVVVLVWLPSCAPEPVALTKDETQLLDAVRNNDLSAVTGLVQAGVDVETADSDGRTPLLIAIASGNPTLVKTLLDLGADSAIADKKGSSAIAYAVQAGGIETIRILLAIPPAAPKAGFSTAAIPEPPVPDSKENESADAEPRVVYVREELSEEEIENLEAGIAARLANALDAYASIEKSRQIAADIAEDIVSREVERATEFAAELKASLHREIELAKNFAIELKESLRREITDGILSELSALADSENPPEILNLTDILRQMRSDVSE